MALPKQHLLEISLRAFVKQWLAATGPSLRPTTADSYAHLLRIYVVPRLGERGLGTLLPADLSGLYAELLSSGRLRGKGGLSPATVRYVHLVVRHLLADACSWGYLERNPAAAVRPPRVPRPEARIWSAEQVGAFLDHVAHEPLYPAFVLASTTGMRRGEVLGLRWADLDPEAARAFVRRSLVAVRYRIQVSEPKTARGRRGVDLDPATVAVLRRHREHQVARGVSVGAGDYVFTGPKGEPVHPVEFTRVFLRRAKKAGLPRIRLHDLRHSYASIALSAGIHPKVVSERLGHSSVMITLDTYSHLIPSLQREAADQVAGLILAGSEALSGIGVP